MFWINVFENISNHYRYPWKLKFIVVLDAIRKWNNEISTWRCILICLSLDVSQECHRKNYACKAVSDVFDNHSSQQDRLCVLEHLRSLNALSYLLLFGSTFHVFIFGFERIGKSQQILVYLQALYSNIA